MFCAVLDVGIGTGTSLCANASLVLSKRLTVVGVDIDEAYVNHCANSLKSAKLSSCRVLCKSVLDPDLSQSVGKDFDAVYFSGSISLIPTPHKVHFGFGVVLFCLCCVLVLCLFFLFVEIDVSGVATCGEFVASWRSCLCDANVSAKDFSALGSHKTTARLASTVSFVLF